MSGGLGRASSQVTAFTRAALPLPLHPEHWLDCRLVHHTQFIWCWGWNLGLWAQESSTPTTELIPSVCLHSFYVSYKLPVWVCVRPPGIPGSHLRPGASPGPALGSAVCPPRCLLSSFADLACKCSVASALVSMSDC